MEINPLPPSLPMSSRRSTSAVGDGNVGQKSPYYRRRQKQRQGSQGEAHHDRPPGLEDSDSHVDIRV